MLKIEQLSKDHDRKGFDCGDKRLNDFLQKTALQHSERNISRTFVLIDDEAQRSILGYYTLLVFEVVPAEIPDPRLQRYPHPIPAAKLARLAVSINIQRNGHGNNLLLNAMERTYRISMDAGLTGMFVDAKDANAARYYLQYDFIPTVKNPLTLYLPIATIRQLFAR